MLLFFIFYGLFHIVDGTLFMAKDGDGTFIQKLTKVHVFFFFLKESYRLFIKDS